MYKHILIPTDGSAVSQKAVDAGIKLARSLGAKVTGFFAAPAATPLIYKGFLPVGYVPAAEREKMIERTAQKYLGAIAEAARKAGVKCETFHASDDYPAEAVVAAAKKRKCDLIFMASHGRSGRKNSLLGSETQKVLTQSPIPVLVHR